MKAILPEAEDGMECMNAGLVNANDISAKPKKSNERCGTCLDIIEGNGQKGRKNKLSKHNKKCQELGCDETVCSKHVHMKMICIKGSLKENQEKKRKKNANCQS